MTTQEKIGEAQDYLDKAITALRDAYIDVRPVLFGALTAVADTLESQGEILEGVIYAAGQDDDAWLTNVQADMRQQRDEPEAYAAKRAAEYDAQMEEFLSQLASGDLTVAFSAPDDAVSVTHLDGVGILTLEPYQVIDGAEIHGTVVQGPDSVSD